MLNKAVIHGRLTAAPELRHTQTGAAVTSFCVAVQRSYVKAGAERQTDFIDFVAWGKTAEFICRNFKKGQLIICEGEIQTRMYTDKTGNNRKAVEIITRAAYFSESQRAEYYDMNQAADSADDFSQIIADDDLPF